MTGKELRIVYMGTPDFAVAPLKALVESGHNIVGVVTMPDKPAGRGLKIQQSAVKAYALEAGLTVLQPEKLKSEEFLGELRHLKPDLGIVVAFRMLPEVVWAMPRLGTFNLHASLLPDYRGAAPINWAIMNGERQTGVTTFLLNSRIDEGAVIGRRTVDITNEDNAGTLHDKLMEVGADLVIETVESIASGYADPQPQPLYGSVAFKPAPKIYKETCRLNFSREGENIVNQIRGLSPYPAAWAELQRIGHQNIPVKIYSASYIPDKVASGRIGNITSDGKTFINVECEDGYISIGDLQTAGKKRMSVQDFLRGFKDIVDYSFI